METENKEQGEANTFCILCITMLNLLATWELAKPSLSNLEEEITTPRPTRNGLLVSESPKVSNSGLSLPNRSLLSH